MSPLGATNSRSETLYAWFVPKNKSIAKSAQLCGAFPLPCALSALINAASDKNDLVVSPGYLSTNQKTATHFFGALGARCKLFANPIRVSFLRGMNYSSQKPTIYQNHLAVLQNSRKFSAGPPFDIAAFSKNHSKLVFLYSPTRPIHVGPDGFVDDVDDFLSSIVVNAAAVGSSNFSDSTYFGGSGMTYHFGEADVILFVNRPSSPTADFSRVVDAFRGSKEQVESNLSDLLAEGADGGGDAARIGNEVECLSHSVLAETQYWGGYDHPRDYLKEMLRLAIND